MDMTEMVEQLTSILHTGAATLLIVVLIYMILLVIASWIPPED